MTDARDDAERTAAGPRDGSSPFTSGAITQGYPFDDRERRALEELERRDNDDAVVRDGGSGSNER